MPLLDRHPVLLLDMNGVFMFGQDRLGPEEDLSATYRALGGTRLMPDEVSRAIRSCFKGMMRDYEDPALFDDFPSVMEGLRAYVGADEADLPHLAATFAVHECGHIPPAHAALLTRLALTHRLGLISNIFSPKAPWLDVLYQARLHDVFEITVFSSDFRSIKPSPALFMEALQKLPGIPRSDILFIGDSLRCDIIPAKALGLTTVWITPEGTAPEADYTLPNLLALESI